MAAPDSKLAAEKKDSKNDAAINFFVPSYFVTALAGVLTALCTVRIERLCYSSA